MNYALTTFHCHVANRLNDKTQSSQRPLRKKASHGDTETQRKFPSGERATWPATRATKRNEQQKRKVRTVETLCFCCSLRFGARPTASAAGRTRRLRGLCALCVECLLRVSVSLWRRSMRYCSANACASARRPLNVSSRRSTNGCSAAARHCSRPRRCVRRTCRCHRLGSGGSE